VRRAQAVAFDWTDGPLGLTGARRIGTLTALTAAAATVTPAPPGLPPPPLAPRPSGVDLRLKPPVHTSGCVGEG